MSKVQENINNIRTYLNAHLLERTEIIDATLSAMLARQHVFMLGPPGTAKSYLVELLSKCFTDSNYFYYLMTPTAKPADLFGPQSLKALKEDDELRYNVEGYLPTVSFSFVDEIFKGNSAVLNRLLPVINERTFKNGKETLSIPLRTMFSASNETPADSSLAALYDRFVVRLYVDNLKANRNFKKFLLETPTAVAPQLTLATLDKAYEEVDKVALSDEFVDKLIELREQLNFDADYADVYVSTRRYKPAVQVVKARVYLEGRTTVERDDIRFIQPCLWSEESQIEKLNNLVISLCSAGTQLASRTIASLGDLAKQLDMAKGVDQLINIKDGIEILSDEISNFQGSHPDLVRAKRYCEVLNQRANAKHSEITGVSGRFGRVDDARLDEAVSEFDY